MSNNKAFIYILKDPLTLETCYVGQTTQPQNRLAGHISTAQNQGSKKERWIYDLILRNLLPIFEIIEECTIEDLDEREKFWIESLSESCKLLNSTYLSEKPVELKRINAIVPEELFDFAQSQNRGNKSYVVRESLDCLRLVQQLAGGQDWREWLERAEKALKNYSD